MRSGKLRYPAKLVREKTIITDSGAESVEYEDVLEKNRTLLADAQAKQVKVLEQLNSLQA